LSELVRELLEVIKSAVLERYCGVSIAQYKLDGYTFIHAEVIETYEDVPVQSAGYVNVLVKRDKRGERILAYSVRVPRNRQLEYELKRALKELKQQSRRRVMTRDSRSSEEGHPS
jgi:hypothetical protein